MKRTLLSLALTLAVALVTIEAPAITIDVANPSFESFDIGGDGFVDGSITDWTEIPFAGFFNGLSDPTDASFPGTTGPPGTIPGGSGDQIAFAQNTGAIYQVISAALNPGGYDLLMPGTFTLTVAVGDRIDFAIGPYYIDLYAGATSIASTNGSSEALPDGVFTDIVLTYTATGSDPNLGQPLSIRLGSDPVLTGVPSQVAYDNVRLESSVPEPSAAVLAAVGLLAMRRRRV